MSKGHKVQNRLIGWWCNCLIPLTTSGTQSTEVFVFNMNKYKSNFSSESNPASGKVELANPPKLCNEWNKSLQDEVRVSCWDALTTTTAAAWGVDPQNLSLFRGKELDESPSSSPQSLFMASCCHCENIIISWWARARTVQILFWSLAACSSRCNNS